MKVVLFCGGLGTRLREHSETIPKPLVNVGYRPIIWHLMRYYAHFGHKEFVLALGYRGDMVRDYFLRYNECMSNDFVLSEGGRKVDLMTSDIADWRITFVDTGLHSNLGERLRRVRRYVEGDDYFLANYSDGLSDLDMNGFIDEAKSREELLSELNYLRMENAYLKKLDALIRSESPTAQRKKRKYFRVLLRQRSAPERPAFASKICDSLISCATHKK